MYRYLKYDGIFKKQFEEPMVKEYSTNVAVVYNASNEEFQHLKELQDHGEEITKEQFFDRIKTSDQYIYEMEKLQALFVEKAEGLKEMLADKASVLPGYIDKQTEIYEYMYQFAKQGVYDAKTNEAIIEANEQAKQAAAELVLLLNEVRSHIEGMIAEGKDIELVYSKAKEIGKETTKEQIMELLALLRQWH